MAFTVEMAIKIVLLTSEPVIYTAEAGAKCPLCGQPGAHAYSLSEKIIRYHRCQTCGLNFKSIASEIIYCRKKGKNAKDYKRGNRDNTENKQVNASIPLQFFEKLNKLKTGE